MNIQYGKSWFRAKKCLTDEWPPTKAANMHQQRKSYVAVVGNAGCLDCFIEFNNDSIGVGFLDKQLREYMCYQFQEIRPGELFLTMAVYREYGINNDVVVNGTIYYFKTNGSVVIEIQDILLKTSKTCNREVNLAANWEKYPEFASYGSLIRRERGLQR